MSGMGCSGCLLQLIQLPIILGLFYMMASPLTNILKLDPIEIEAYKKEVGEMKKIEASSDFYFAVAGMILGVCGVLLFVFMVLHWIFIHCGWSLVPRDKAVTTPNKAIWLNFVPGLMPFWNWVTYFELGRHYSELTGRRGNKVLALIMSVMTTLGGPVLLLAWFVILLVMQGELLRSAEIISQRKGF